MALSGPPTGRLAAAAVTGLLVLTLAGCGGSDDGGEAAEGSSTPSASASAADGEPRLVQGGEPGEQATEVPSDTTMAPNEWSHDDEMFMQMMIPHHAQALEMTELAAEHATDRRVRLLAERISAAQGPEISMMAAWLEERDLEVPRASDDPLEFDHGEHGHMEMTGMLTQAQLGRLGTARGEDFDRLFLRYMIGHHEGAVQMADETAGGGLDVRVGETRDDISSSQSAEIARMEQLLDQL
ncbi:DUF305 domain-containing protein [Nocardioides aequoreus]|uniref:DUF305 domain-containing protein n=1 Tax=Nocardioides aequoreus TaxID=397278 RepID=UPI00068C60E4|nr:DUF305 domain-containing protein [Nocardioides aequoreus]